MTFWIWLSFLLTSRWLSPREKGGSKPADRLFWTLFARAFTLLGLVVLSKEGWAQWPIVVAVALVCVPELFLRYVVCPFHLPRTAYCVVRLFWPVDCIGNVQAAAVFYAGLTMTRAGPTEREINWWSKLLLDQSAQKGNFGIATIGLQAAFRKDAVTARAAFSTLDQMSPRPWSRPVRRVAREWLVMDASRRAQWLKVAGLGRRGLDSHRCTFAISCIAELRLGEPKAFGPAVLKLLCLISPRSRGLLHLLNESILERDAFAEELPFLRAANGDVRTGGLHARLVDLSRPDCQIPEEIFQLVVRTIQDQLDSPELRESLLARLRTLDPARVPDPQSAIIDLQEEVIDLLIPAMEARPSLVRGIQEVPLVKEAVGRIENSTLARLRVQCRDAVARCENKKPLDLASEWAFWARIRDAADRLEALSPDAEEAVFAETWKLVKFAVFQHEVMLQPEFAKPIFQWLHDHAASHPEFQRSMLTWLKG